MMTRRRIVSSILVLLLLVVLVPSMTGCSAVLGILKGILTKAAASPTPETTPAVTDEATPTPYDETPSVTFGPTAPGSVEDALAKYFDALPAKYMSGGDAIAEYLDKIGPVVDSANLEAVFGAYNAFIWNLAFTLMEPSHFGAINDQWTNNHEAFVANLRECGLMAVDVEGSFVLRPDYTSILTKLAPVLTARAQQYCAMMTIQQDTPPVGNMGEVLYLRVDLTTLANMLADWDAFCDPLGDQVYPMGDGPYTGHYRAQSIRHRLLQDFLGGDTFDGQPMFDAADVMTTDFRDAYDHFLSVSPDSSSAAILASYKAALEAHAWKRSGESYDVLINNDLSYMSGYTP